jgi:hypothetical protein
VAKQDPEEVRKRLMREAAEEALAEAADADPAVAKWLDDDFAEGMTEILGMSPGALQKELGKSIPGITDDEIKQAMRDAKAAQEAMKGKGFLGKPDPELAARILSKSKGLKKLAKAKKGCAVVGLLLLVIGSSSLTAAIYGAIEAIAMVTR